MTKITVDAKEAKAIAWGDSYRYVIHEQGDWISAGKYENRDTIVRDEETQRYYRISEWRSGSPYSEYVYSWEQEDEATLVEVHAVEVTHIEWRTVGEESSDE